MATKWNRKYFFNCFFFVQIEVIEQKLNGMTDQMNHKCDCHAMWNECGFYSSHLMNRLQFSIIFCSTLILKWNYFIKIPNLPVTCKNSLQKRPKNFTQKKIKLKCETSKVIIFAVECILNELCATAKTWNCGLD